ncbi:MAG: hypothetical protein E7454_00325 [Ruminococcaceae bacterium]|nr:hypothetical protein [Oscillospiraceae bacterium]
MKKTWIKIVSLLVLVCLTVGCFAGCQTSDQPGTTAPSGPDVGPFVDYAATTKLDKSTSTVKQEVTVKTFVDGDTTHFYVPSSVMEHGVLKARYLAINTPESTGKIEEYGKKASAFTRQKLEKATSIIIESDNETWNADSTGDRYLVWVWYKTAEMSDYRNLNLELLQNGLAIASNTAQNRYGTICMNALNQAKAHKLNVFSGEKDPDFYYGEAHEITLKELRTNTEAYGGQKVAFNGIVTLNNGQGVYVESLDEESGLYYGMYVYYGFNLTGTGLSVVKPGNEVRIVGSLQYYETGGTWQVADLKYDLMDTKNPNNIQKLSDGHSPAFVTTTAATFNSTVEVDMEDGKQSFPYAQLAMNSTIEMKNLVVKDIYTTSKEDSSSKGAMTLTCEVDGQRISVRTVVLKDDDGNLITASAYLGKTIDVKGAVDYFDGGYQIKVFTDDHITVHN